MRVTNEVLATSPDQTNKRGLATSGASASALGCSAHRNVERHRGHAFSSRRFAGAGCGANKVLHLTQPSVALSWRGGVWRRRLLLRAGLDGRWAAQVSTQPLYGTGDGAMLNVRFDSTPPFRCFPRSRPTLASNSEREPSKALGKAKQAKAHVRAPIFGRDSFAKRFPIRPGAVARAIHHNRLAAEYPEVSEVRV